MRPTDLLLASVVGLFALVLILWGFNLVRVVQKRAPLLGVSRAMYLAAVLAAALSAVRNGLVYTDKTLLAANLIVLLSLIAAFSRAERKKPESPSNEEGGEPPFSNEG